MKTTEKFSVTTGSLPASRKIYVDGVAMREISINSGKDSIKVYDTSGAYTDPDAKIDIYKGLPKLRAEWIKARGDVEEYAGREVKPEDNGLKQGSEFGIRDSVRIRDSFGFGILSSQLMFHVHSSMTSY